MNNASRWSTHLGSFRLEDESRPFNELVLRSADDAEVASLVPLPQADYVLPVGDAHQTSVALPEGSWEVSVIDSGKRVADTRVVVRLDKGRADEPANRRDLTIWAMLSVLSVREPRECLRG